MCKFCENSEIVRDDCVAYGYSMHTRTTILSNKRVIDTKFSTIEPFESNFQEMDFRINYCPMCGRDLMNENRENCEYLSLETIKGIYEKSVNMAKCKYAVCDYYDGKNVYCITDDLSEAEFECFVKIDHPGNVVYDLEKDEVVWEVKDLGLDDKTLELVTKLKRSWQTNE